MFVLPVQSQRRVESMPRCIEAVPACHGDPTRQYTAEFVQDYLNVSISVSIPSLTDGPKCYCHIIITMSQGHKIMIIIVNYMCGEYQKAFSGNFTHVSIL